MISGASTQKVLSRHPDVLVHKFVLCSPPATALQAPCSALAVLQLYCHSLARLLLPPRIINWLKGKQRGSAKLFKFAHEGAPMVHGDRLREEDGGGGGGGMGERRGRNGSSKPAKLKKGRVA